MKLQITSTKLQTNYKFKILNSKLPDFLVIGVLMLFVICSLGFGILRAQTIDPGKVSDARAKLEAELAQLEAQIEKEESIIKDKQRQATTLERDIAILDAQINKSRLEIKARNIRIGGLIGEIDNRTVTVNKLENKLNEEKISLAELLRRINEMDSTNLVEILLGYNVLSDFFSDFSSFEAIQKELQASFNEIKETQTKTVEERTKLEDRKAEEVGLRNIQELEKKSAEKREAEKNNLLKVTKGEEKKYQKILNERKKDAAEIRSQLFLLAGSAAIPFEKAVEYANAAFKATGVRPAFLLGVITQETNLGENIGQCLLTNSPSKGDGKGKNTGRFFKGVMKPSRDVDPFMNITSRLGLDPMQMPVSCPQAGGYGGAMGPAQFIPSTWVLYENQLASLTGHNPVNPWNPYDAFMASALLLSDNGASGGGYTAERTAALKYFAGGNWNKRSYAFYGDDVMAIAAKYQEQIDIISK